MPDFNDVRTVLLSLLPGLFWVVYLRSLSRGKVSPWWHWLVALLAGWFSTEVTLFVSDLLQVSRLQMLPYAGSLIYFVLGVGLVEEGAKAVCALLALKLPGFCKQPLFGLQLCGGVALGFATAENVLYAKNFGDSVLFARFVFSTLGHVLFASVWGFALGSRLEKQGDEFRQKTVWGAFIKFLLLSAIGHGLYDWFLMSGRPVLAILTLAVLWMGFREAVLGAFLRQEYRREVPFATAPCPHCSVLTRAEANYCSFCGQRLKEEEPESTPEGSTSSELELPEPTA